MNTKKIVALVALIACTAPVWGGKCTFPNDPRMTQSDFRQAMLNYAACMNDKEKMQKEVEDGAKLEKIPSSDLCGMCGQCHKDSCAK